MEDLYKVLIGMEDQTAKNLALRLEKFIKGSLSGIFNQQSNFDITNPFTVFSIKALEEELRPIAMHIILDFVWTRVRKSLKKRLLILDEAWALIDNPVFAPRIKDWLKVLRKLNAMVIFATQSVEDATKSSISDTLVQQTATQIFLPNFRLRVFQDSGGRTMPSFP